MSFLFIERSRSDLSCLSHDIPQGSIPALLLIILSMLPFGNIVRWHGLWSNCYADNMQNSIHTDPSIRLPSLALINYLTDLKTCM